MRNALKYATDLDEEPKYIANYMLWPTSLDTEGEDAKIYGEVFGVSLHMSSDISSYCGM